MKLNFEQQRKEGAANEAGLTLIECLVAMVVITITLATIAPMMVFSVATRVQNQKTEQALQLAQGEIDKVRRVVEQGGDYGDRLASISLVETSASVASVVAAPDDFIASTATASTATQARRLDTDGDGDSDFLIQLFRTEGIEIPPQNSAVTASTPIVFDIGVRVYDARAENSTVPLETADSRLTFTSSDGDRSSRPLAALYSQITQGDRDASLCNYWEYTGSTPDALFCN